MQSPLIIVTGTGTGIGKTVFATALLRALGRSHKVIGFKPAESGYAIEHHRESDVGQLEAASTFHVKHPTPPPYLLRAPISPHLAARRQGITIDPEAVTSTIASLRTAADAVVVELPGGLCSPLTDTLLNAELCERLAPTLTLLVAPDRLGVLHDVIAAYHAAHAYSVQLSGIVLNAPGVPDASTGTNAEALAPLVNVPVLLQIPRLGPLSFLVDRACRTMIGQLIPALDLSNP